MPALRKTWDRSPAIIVMAEEVPPVDGIGYLPFVRHLTDAVIVVVGPGGEVFEMVASSKKCLIIRKPRCLLPIINRFNIKINLYVIFILIC